MPGRKFSRKFQSRRYGGKSKYVKKTNNTKKMMGHAVNYALQKAKGAGGYLGMLARNVDMLKSFINVETKYKDTVSTSTVGDNPGTYFVNLNDIAEGDDYNQRSGRSILNDSLTINYSVTSVAAQANTYVRIIVVADLKPDIGAASAADLLGAGGTYLSQIDKATNGDRFVILKSLTIATTSVLTNIPGKIHLNLKGTHTLFDATTADWEKNKLIVMAVSNIPIASNPPTLAFNARFRYKDN